MKKSLSTLAGIMLLASVSAQTTDKMNEWRTCAKGFKYESKGFSCDIGASGVIRNLRVGDVILFKQSQLYGKYDVVEGKKYDSRFFQTLEKKQLPELQKIGENSYRLKKIGTLFNKKYKPAAKYNETISLSPGKITFEYEIEILVPLYSKSAIFRSLNALPLSSFIGKGFKLTDQNDKDSLMIFPRTYSKSSSLHCIGKMVKVSLEHGIFTITVGKDARFILSDTRGWNGKNFRMDICKNVPWKSKPVEFPVEKKFKWSFELTYEKSK